MKKDKEERKSPLKSQWQAQQHDCYPNEQVSKDEI